jgi:ribonuclease HI
MRRINALNMLMQRAAAVARATAPSTAPVALESRNKCTKSLVAAVFPFPGELKAYVADNEHALMFDGGSRGNPGICGAGAVIYKGESELWCGSEFVSQHDTNNFAEYKALIMGLQQVVSMSIGDLIILGDSQLVINQVMGTAKTRAPALIPLRQESVSLISWISEVRFMHIKRHLNRRADALANVAMDAHPRS